MFASITTDPHITFWSRLWTYIFIFKHLISLHRSRFETEPFLHICTNHFHDSVCICAWYSGRRTWI
jgi:hypothetical protein